MTDTPNDESLEAAAPAGTQSSEHLRIIEATLFAADGPLTREQIAEFLPDGVPVQPLLDALCDSYAMRGINLVERGGKWHFQTAADLGHILKREKEQARKLSRAALETLAIIAYHEPVTRADIEDIRGVTISKGTLDVLMEAGWVRPAGRREVPGRPLLYATTQAFLVHFGLASRRDLPGLAELKAAGLLDPVDAAMAQLQFDRDAGDAADTGTEMMDVDVDEPAEPLPE
jgi:segregation and condensation protein B